MFNVEDFGAIADDNTVNTVAFRNCTNAAREAGGGVVRVPGPGIYHTGAFNLSSHTTLHIDEGATVFGANVIEDYPLIAPLPSYGDDFAASGSIRKKDFLLCVDRH